MDLATLETVVRRQFKAAAGNPLSFMFQGGEPLLAGHDFFVHFGRLVRKYRSPGQLVTLAVQTNGTLIDCELADIFKDNDFLGGGVFYFCSAYKALFKRLVPVVGEFVARVMWHEATPLERTLE